MRDLEKVRDTINEALSMLPVAATWLYTIPSISATELHIAIVPASPIAAERLVAIGKSLERDTGCNRAITDLSFATYDIVEYVMYRGTVIEDREPLTRQAFIDALIERRAREKSERIELQQALDKIRVRYAR